MEKNGKVIVISILVMLACIGFAAAAAPEYEPGSTSTWGVVPDLGMDNAMTCAAAGCDGTTTLPIVKAETESYDGIYYIDATHWINIDAYDGFDTGEENSIRWTSNFDVECVVLKGGDGYDTYYCTDHHKQADGSMSTPYKKKFNPDGSYRLIPSRISHILICYFPTTNVPEFPAWFISVMGIAVMAGLLVALRRK